MGCRIFHDVVGTGFNIDHVIVSGRGIFAIETKTYSKPANGSVAFDGERVTLSGKRPDSRPIKQARDQANWLSHEFLYRTTQKKFPVTPVVVFPGWWVDPPHKIKGTWVMNPKVLGQGIEGERMSLTPEDVHLVATHLALWVTEHK